MKRNAFTFSLFSVFFGLLFISCKEEAPSEAIQFDPPISNLAGTVVDWSLGDTITAVAGRAFAVDSIFVFGSSVVDSSGNFSVPLLAPPTHFLYPFSNYASGDPEARFFQMPHLILRSPDGNHMNQVLRNGSVPQSTFYSDSSNVGDYTCMFLYTDRNVRMRGNSQGGIYVYNVDLILSKGWNRTVRKITSKQVNQVLIDDFVDNRSTGNWYHEQ